MGGCATGGGAVKKDKAFEEDRANIRQELLAQLGVTEEGVSSDNSATACVEERFGFEPNVDTEIAKMQAIQYMVEQACSKVFFVKEGRIGVDGRVKVPGFDRKSARTYGPEKDDDTICVSVTLARGAKIQDIKCGR